MKDEEKEDDKELIEEEKKAKAVANKIAGVIKKLNETSITNLSLNGKVDTGDKDVPTVTRDIVLIKKEFHKNISSDKGYHSFANSECGIRISTLVNDQILNNYYCRDLTNKIQRQRKETGIKITDAIIVSLNIKDNSPKLAKVVEEFKDNITKVIKVKLEINAEVIEGYEIHSDKEYNVAEEQVRVVIFKKK